jgi:hypothetical protein
MKTKYTRPIGIVILNLVLQSSFYLINAGKMSKFTEKKISYVNNTNFWPLDGFKSCEKKAFAGGHIEFSCKTNIFFGYDITELVVYSILIPLAVYAIFLIIRR